jgi:hypothetical protein
MNKIIGITVSKNYDDLLQIAIDNNVDLFEKWYIVTQEDDEKTINVVKKCAFPNVDLLFYPLVPGCSSENDVQSPFLGEDITASNSDMNFTNNVKFDKGGAIKMVQKNYTSIGDLVLIIDSDIVIPKHTKDFIRSNKFKKNKLYGAIRFDYGSYEDFLSNSNPIHYTDAFSKKQYRSLHVDGYFHLYVNTGITYDRSESAAYPDTWFKYKYCRLVRGKNKIKVGDIIVHKTKIVAKPPIRDVINNVEVDEVEVDENDVVKYVEVRNLYGAKSVRVHITEIMTSFTDEGLETLPKKFNVCHLGESDGNWTRRTTIEFNDKKTNKLPDFIGCGFQKCATSALSINLNQHPDIHIPFCEHDDCPYNVEFNFFSSLSQANTWHLGVDWYKSNFPNDGRMCGEISPNYSWVADEVSKKIYENHPNAKLLFSLRNPIDRAYSAYNMYTQLYPKSKEWGKWDVNESFIWNLKNTPAFHINYLEVLKEYAKYFSKDQIHYIIQERLKTDSSNEYNKIFDFLNVKHYEIKNKDIHTREKERDISEQERNECKNVFGDWVHGLFDFLGYEIKEWTDFC